MEQSVSILLCNRVRRASTVNVTPEAEGETESDVPSPGIARTPVETFDQLLLTWSAPAFYILKGFQDPQPKSHVLL